MIRAIATTTDLEGFEQLYIVGESTPENPFSATLVRADLTVEEQVTYDEALGLFNNNKYTQIDDTTSELSIDRMTSIVLTIDKEVVSFLTYTEPDKDKLRNLLTLAVTHKD